jgi:dTDP-4-dehydrorhamnose 3,5-epimerase
VKFSGTPLEGALLVEPEPQGDERGFFARSYCREEFAAQGVDFAIAQASVSFNRAAGTLRGLHYQAPPHAEAKLVRCTAGALFDVIVDLRESSPTRRRWFSVELSAANRRMLFVPPGLAHGFQTLADATEVEYLISAPYRPEAARGVRWDDPLLAIAWPPVARRVISERDLAFPLLA